jgi:probable F420-dependent oxidoreductase
MVSLVGGVQAPVDFGLVLPPCTDPGTLLATLKYADGAGFHTVWVPDRTIAEVPFLDALSVLGALAVATTRVRIGPVSLIASRRNPVLTAHALASIDHLSDGRLVVGVGVGGIEPNEFAVVGVDPASRGALTDEHLHLWRRLWSQADVDHDGRGFHCQGVTIGPPPAGRIPVWIAGSSPAAQRRAGRLGDGWIPVFTTPTRYGRQWEVVTDAASAADRDPMAIVPGVYLFGSIGSTAADPKARLDAALQRMLGSPLASMADSCLCGTPGEWVEQIGRWTAVGVRHVSALLFSDDLERDVRLVGEEVLPALRSISSDPR